MAKKPTAAADASPVADFETSMQALEDLVGKMEAGEMTLEESLAAYERAGFAPYVLDPAAGHALFLQKTLLEN